MVKLQLSLALNTARYEIRIRDTSPLSETESILIEEYILRSLLPLSPSLIDRSLVFIYMSYVTLMCMHI